MLELESDIKLKQATSAESGELPDKASEANTEPTPCDQPSEYLVRCDKKETGIDTLQFDSAGFLDKARLKQQLQLIKGLSNEQYTEQVLSAVDDRLRPSAVTLVHSMADKVIEEQRYGPLVMMRIEIRDDMCDQASTTHGSGYQVAVVIQNRAARNGIWLPEHHVRVLEWLASVSAQRLPVITFIDTPGADAGDFANEGLQAQSISHLIAAFTKLDVPSIGVIYGKGYSGGAIPLASTNVLFALTDSVFNTIQPQGLAAIARKEKLSWQQCAQWVGISAVELMADRVIDGVIDYSPRDIDAQITNVKKALLSTLNGLSKPEVVANIRQLRFETLRSRLSYQYLSYAEDSVYVNVEPKNKSAAINVSNLSSSQDSYQQWLVRSNPLKFNQTLAASWRSVVSNVSSRQSGTGRIGQSFSSPQFYSLEPFSLSLAIELFHQWQGQSLLHLKRLKASDGSGALLSLEAFIEKNDIKDLELPHFLAVNEVKELLLHHLEFLILLDTCYDEFLSEIINVAWEYSLNESLSLATVKRLWLAAKAKAVDSGIDRERSERFLNWLQYLLQEHRLVPLIQRMNQWKQHQYPQTDSVLLVVAGYFVETLLIRLYFSQIRGIPFDGAFQPKLIGRYKNFWHRLTQASRNVRIQKMLDETKSQRLISAEQWQEWLFTDFELMNHQLVTKDAKVFPGFAKRIKQTVIEQGLPCGIATGLGRLKSSGHKVAAFMSNIAFQAGAFDMACAEKFCRLLETADAQQLPVIGFVSSAGMQTKEGAASLFSMAVVNEAINRFVDQGNRLMIVAYGDCTGGAQASLVTHPDIDTYYLSGTNLPFAGQVVVPEHLTLQTTLANYLSSKLGESGFACMKGLIRHPLMPALDRSLKEIDPTLDESQLTVSEVIKDWLYQVPSTGLSLTTPNYQKKRFRPIRQVLIHARGCTAVRLIEAAHKLSKRVVLVQSDSDMKSLAAEALKGNDSLVCLGGQSSDESYLNARSVLRVAELERVDALHPGIGFLSENADFAAACQNQSLNFIGPDSNAISRMGDKAQAIETAKRAGVPTVPGSDGIVSSDQMAEQVMSDIGLPLLIKATHGGGGKGIGTVYEPSELIPTLQRVRQEALQAFGNGEVYIERLVETVRHIEIQLLRDAHGNSRIVGVRDCSSQRNRQKIIEESGEYLLTDVQVQALRQWSKQLADSIHYIGAGTLEFLYDLNRQCFYFMEMNTRLQVEHIVTEMTSGIDLVEQQFLIAEGESIKHLPEAIDHQGHAIEVRINAESIHSEQIVSHAGLKNRLVVTPATGVFSNVVFPEKPYVRTLSVAGKGKEISPFYDSLVAQVVVLGKTREQALQRLNDYLDECFIDGVNTNLALLKCLLRSDLFAQGKIDTSFVDEWVTEHGQLLKHQASDVDAPINATSPYLEQSGSEWLLKLPNAGVVYAAPTPESDPFVKQGDVVTGEQTLFLLEVMKMFMPITVDQFFKGGGADKQYQVLHCRDLDGQFLQQGEVILTLKSL